MRKNQGPAINAEQEFKQLALNEAAYYGNAIARQRNKLQTIHNSSDYDEFKVVSNYFSPKASAQNNTTSAQLVNGILAGDINHIYNYTQSK